jgi:hypothetical protein
MTRNLMGTPEKTDFMRGMTISLEGRERRGDQRRRGGSER